MNDRDHFAAAALTGLLVHANDGIDEETLDTPSDIAYTAFQMADAMLRERELTNHDAAPAARATADRYVRRAAADGDSDRTDKAAPRPSEGTGDTPVAESATTTEPVAWAVRWDGYDGIDCEFVYQEQEEAQSVAGGQDGANVVPLYRRPQPALTDAEREAVETAVSEAEAHQHTVQAATLRGLMERTK